MSRPPLTTREEELAAFKKELAGERRKPQRTTAGITPDAKGERVRALPLSQIKQNEVDDEELGLLRKYKMNQTHGRLDNDDGGADSPRGEKAENSQAVNLEKMKELALIAIEQTYHKKVEIYNNKSSQQRKQEKKPEPLPGMFVSFIKTDLLNRYLVAAVKYFTVLFKAEEDNRHAPHHGAQTDRTGQRTGSAPQPMNDHLHMALREFGSTYASILMEYCEKLHKKNRQEKLFFEALFNYTRLVMCAMFDNQMSQVIENQLGDIFRTSQFNINRHKNEKVKKMERAKISARDLYVIKYEKEPEQANRFLNSLDVKVPRLNLAQAVGCQSLPITQVCLTAPSRVYQPVKGNQKENLQIQKKGNSGVTSFTPREG
eukprot:GFYU01004112.1.p1 GENE.GFYU01004112.1~~GFYU01004112.1.p1  ORF type:complete len:373 (-),score=84.40 GFYU01004112.1:231-1349(-)